MPIRMRVRPIGGDRWPAGAYCDLAWSEREGAPAVVVETHVGQVLEKRTAQSGAVREAHALVWNDDRGAPEWIMYRTSVALDPINACLVDATPATLAKLEAWREDRATVRRISEEAAAEARLLTHARDCGLPVEALRRIMAAYRGDDLKAMACVRLLRSHHKGAVTSRFRRKLAEQIRAWALEPGSRWLEPLSPEQMKYLAA